MASAIDDSSKIAVELDDRGRLKTKMYINVSTYFPTMDDFIAKVVGDFKNVIGKKHAALALAGEQIQTNEDWNKLLDSPGLRLQLIDKRNPPKIVKKAVDPEPKSSHSTEQRPTEDHTGGNRPPADRSQGNRAGEDQSTREPTAAAAASMTTLEVHNSAYCTLCTDKIHGNRNICVKHPDMELCPNCLMQSIKLESNDPDTSQYLVVRKNTTDCEILNTIERFAIKFKEKMAHNFAGGLTEEEFLLEEQVKQPIEIRYPKFKTLSEDQQRLVQKLDEIGMDNCMQKIIGVPREIQGEQFEWIVSNIFTNGKFKR